MDGIDILLSATCVPLACQDFPRFANLYRTFTLEIFLISLFSSFSSFLVSSRNIFVQFAYCLVKTREKDNKVASIPFRFKASSSMAPSMESHHHRNTTKVSHKAFKSRHSTKGFIKDLSKGKVEGVTKRSHKTLHQQVMSKIDRRHQARQLKQLKHQENFKASNVFSGQNGAPRVVAVVPLCEENDPELAIQKLNQGLEHGVELSSIGPSKVKVDRFKQTLLYVPIERNLLTALDACRVADFVILLLSPTQGVGEEGEIILRAIEGQGISNVLTMVQNLDKVEPPKRRSQVVSSLKSYIAHFFPTQEKIHSLDLDRECTNVIRTLCTTTPKGVKWREDRSWMFVENVAWPQEGDSSHREVVISGVVRGRGLNANRLVQLGDWGHFQIDKIVDASQVIYKKRKADEMAIDAEIQEAQVLELPDGEQDDLADIAPYEATMEHVSDMPISEAPTERRGVLLDDHHYFSDDNSHLPEAPRRLPRGTSSYQAAWFLGDISDSGSDVEDALDEEGDITMDAPALPQDGLEGLDHATQRDPTEATPSEYPQSEMFLDPSPDDEAAQLAAYRSQRRNEAEDDLEFPDEIELLPNVLARERLARYRGLKSLKTSRWETEEDRAYEPEDWNRLLQIPDYKKAKKQATREALVGGVQLGKRVDVHLRGVPLSWQEMYNSKTPLAMFSLLRHEQKRTIINFTITLRSDYPASIRSKEELIVQCGSRRLVINPLFSHTGNTSNNVHKSQRYLHPGQTAMATFIAPLTWGAVPVLYFKQMDDIQGGQRLELIATGTSQAPDRARVIAKRIILTGHPYKIHKKIVTVRYMFFNKEDVDWFKALQLWTKRGRSGFIKESLGTHGYFKATFDGKINPQDAVGVSLYKRVFPRTAKPWNYYSSKLEDQ